MSKNQDRKRKGELARNAGSPLDNISDNEETLQSEIVEIKQELVSVNPHVFDGLDEKKEGEILRAFSQITMSVTERRHSGPLPSAETMIQYNSVIPNGADRIMIMAEKQQDHRMAMENKMITSQLYQSKAGQILGFILCFLSLSASVYLGINGHEAIGTVIGTTTIIAMGGIFVLGKLVGSGKYRKEESKENED